MAGPQRARLDQGLSGASEQEVERAVAEWRKCTAILTQISRALATASPQVKQEIGGQTGPAVDAAFTRSSQGMTEKATQLTKGSAALQAAASAIATARQEQEYLAAHPLQEPEIHTASGPGQPSEQDLKREASSRQAHREYQSAQADQEERARVKADHLDKVFEQSANVMKEIHGEPDPVPPRGDDGGGGGNSGGGGYAPRQPTTGPSTGSAGGGNGAIHPVPGSQPPTGNGGGADYVPGGGGSDDGGAAQGGGTTIDPTTSTPGGTIPGGLTTTGSGGSSGLSGTTGLGLAGAVAGGAGGGLLGTGLATGGIRGGGIAPIATGGGTASSGVRGIGATSRSGVSATLGRSGGIGAVSSGTGTGTPGRGASSSRGAAGGRAAAGGRGAAAGARGAAAGSTVGGRTGRSKDDEKKPGRDRFDIDEDWVDDEGVAPGVID